MNHNHSYNDGYDAGVKAAMDNTYASTKQYSCQEYEQGYKDGFLVATKILKDS